MVVVLVHHLRTAVWHLNWFLLWAEKNGKRKAVHYRGTSHTNANEERVPERCCASWAICSAGTRGHQLSTKVQLCICPQTLRGLESHAKTKMSRTRWCLTLSHKITYSTNFCPLIITHDTQPINSYDRLCSIKRIVLSVELKLRLYHSCCFVFTSICAYSSWRY